MTDTTAPPRIRRAIEDSFPIVEINRLAVPERNSFKPIYQMYKWFARRASCVFRAILLGCLKPLPVDENGKPTKAGAQVIMEEFYKDHTNDPAAFCPSASFLLAWLYSGTNIRRLNRNREIGNNGEQESCPCDLEWGMSE